MDKISLSVACATMLGTYGCHTKPNCGFFPVLSLIFIWVISGGRRRVSQQNLSLVPPAVGKGYTPSSMTVDRTMRQNEVSGAHQPN